MSRMFCCVLLSLTWIFYTLCPLSLYFQLITHKIATRASGWDHFITAKGVLFLYTNSLRFNSPVPCVPKVSNRLQRSDVSSLLYLKADWRVCYSVGILLRTKTLRTYKTRKKNAELIFSVPDSRCNILMNTRGEERVRLIMPLLRDGRHAVNQSVLDLLTARREWRK